MIIQANKFDEMMEREFMPAAGQRRNCGGMPKRLAVRYMGKGGKTRYNADYDSYRKCVDEVRKMNIQAGLPPSTGLDGGLPPDNQQKPNMEIGTGEQTKSAPNPLIIGLYVAGGVTVLIGGYFLIKKMRAPKSIASQPAVAGK